jgi:hypothetical protein
MAKAIVDNIDHTLRNVVRVKRWKTRVHIGAKGRMFNDSWTFYFADGSKHTVAAWSEKNGAPIILEEESSDAETIVN